MARRSTEAASGIGRLNEKPLHAALKRWAAQPGDEFEVAVDGYVVDVARGDLLIEIQTSGFSAIRRKLEILTQHHPVRLVHPIPREKWIVRRLPDGTVRRRKSPKRGRVELVFQELAGLPQLLSHPSFSLAVLLTQEEEVRRRDPARRRWRGWVKAERRLLRVVEQRLFASPADLAALLPAGLPSPFTTSDLASALGLSRRLAQQMAYCLRGMGALARVGRRADGILYARAEPEPRRGIVFLGSEPLH